eukprot:3511856-Amphidinium_carterae.2
MPHRTHICPSAPVLEVPEVCCTAQLLTCSTSTVTSKHIKGVLEAHGGFYGARKVFTRAVIPAPITYRFGGPKCHANARSSKGSSMMTD